MTGPPAESFIRNILIYRHDLLGYSETFILNQGESLKRFRPWYVGCRTISGLRTPQDRTLVLLREGYPHPLSILREWIFKATGFSPRLRSATKTLYPALVHAHFASNALPALSLARSLRVPLIVTVHGADATIRDDRPVGLSHRLYVARRGVLARDASLVIAVSEFLRGCLLAQGFHPDKVIVHRIGIDRSYFAPASGSSEATDPVVLFVGRLVEKKGCQYLISAMNRLGLPDAQLVVIGDGPLRESLEAQAVASGVHVRFLGIQPSTVVREHMRKARVLAVPSVTAENGDSEGLGMVCLEAQAMRLPVVGFATGGIPEAVLHGKTGLLSPQRDVDGLASDLRRLLEDSTLAESMGMAGEEHVRLFFDLTTQTQELEDIYESVVP